MRTDDQFSSDSVDIIPPELAIQAMRDSGYQSTAHALAELIDNSVQANANNVEIFCLQEDAVVLKRTRTKLTEIAVLDNGHGMSTDVLRVALQFGNGTRLRDRTGIGRFGMGLPNSSISQCLLVEIWTWQNGPDNAMHTYLDVNEICSGNLRSVPEPINKPVPKEWRARANFMSTTGTLVLWKNLDDHKMTWRGAKTTLHHTGKLVGRIYRKFINRGELDIRLVTCSKTAIENEEFVLVNDPLYLMKNSSTPTPFDKEPMFQPWGERDSDFHIQVGERLLTVNVRMSYARQETVPQDRSERGNRPYGKDAKNNLGVSIVRAGRELQLDTRWANAYDPVERWWGVEVEFPPELDEIFGVTNNKQSATTFSNLANFDYEQEFEEGETSSEFNDRVKVQGDPRALLWPIKRHIEHQLSLIRKKLKSQTKGSRTKLERHDHPMIADLATSLFNQRKDEGNVTESDKQTFSIEDRDALVEDLKADKDYPESTAQMIADAVLRRGRRVEFLYKSMEGYAFFNVEHKPGGLTAIVFNTEHAFYKQIKGTLELNLQDCTEKELLDKLNSASETIELLFAAWARYEMEEARSQVSFFEMKQEWGKMAGIFLSESVET